MNRIIPSRQETNNSRTNTASSSQGLPPTKRQHQLQHHPTAHRHIALPNMTFQQELASWFSPVKAATNKAPKIGDKAPHTHQLPLKDGKPTIIAFLRHCGCPFAEKAFLQLRDTAHRHRDIEFIAVSHSDEQATQNWLKSLPQAGSEPSNLHVVVDPTRESYDAWGLGGSSFLHVLNPSALYETYRVAKEEGFYNRPTESGSRWQTSGFWAVDSSGNVRWGRVAESAGDVPQFEEATSAIT